MKKRYIRLIIVIVMLIVLSATITGCEYLEQLSPASEEEQNTEEEALHPIVKTSDRAILAIYEHLLSQAEGYKAKAYLANFYTVSDNWSADQETFKDGSTLWHVTLDMTEVKVWRERPYWQQASWFVLRESKVIPSNRFQANALRIEADLQELSLPSPP